MTDTQKIDLLTAIENLKDVDPNIKTLATILRLEIEFSIARVGPDARPQE